MRDVCAALAFLALALSSGMLALLLYREDARLVDTHADIARLTGQAQRTIAGTSANVNALVIQLGLAADNLRRASERQEEYHARGLRVFDNLSAAIVQVQGKTLPALDLVASSTSSAIAANSAESVKALQAATSAIQAFERGETQTFSETQKTLTALQSSIAQLEALERAAAPAITATVGSAENIRESTESVKQALAPLRKAEGRLKYVLKILLGMVKLDPRR